jgi:deoxyribonucleoside regulator
MIKDEILKIKIAKLFYQSNLSKIEIGEKLRISRLKVASLLESAFKDGIVKIIINEPENSFIDLENKIEKKFGINRAVVIETSINYEETKKNIGKAAANCFEGIVYDNDIIGLAWGSSIYEMVNALPQRIDRKNITIVQITGGSNQVPIDVNASELTRRIAKIFNAKSFYLHAPAIVNTKEVRDILISENSIKNTFEMFNKVNLAIVGIGSTFPVPSTTLYRDGFIKSDDFNYISKNCVGDINSYFHDKDGIECNNILHDRVIGMNLKQLKKVRNVMAIAGGEQKINAIYGALRGRLVNIIVTDYKTAVKILEKE